MPAYKHPCPYCSKYIDSGVAACPFCGVTEPFSQGRCPDCRAQLQPGWIACPKCGRSLTAADAAAADAATADAATSTPPTPNPAPTAPATASQPPAAETARCTGCGAALPAGARFCTACGTLVS